MAKFDSIGKKTMSVLVTDYIGTGGAAFLAKKCRDSINDRYPIFLTERALGWGDECEEKKAKAFDIFSKYMEELGLVPGESCFCHEISEGGFLTALWNIAKESGLGMELDLRKVPVRQETIEICEVCEVNPYHLLSKGSLLIIAPEGNVLLEKLGKAGIFASIIGSTNSGNARILQNDETVSYLNRPEPDEILRFHNI